MSVLVFPLLAIISMAVGQAYLLTLEWLCHLYPALDLLMTLEPVLPIIGTFTGILGGFAGIYQLWTRRDRYLAKSEETAYQRALPFGVVGVGLLFTTMLNGFVPVYQLSRQTRVHPLSVMFADPAIPWALRVVPGMGILGITVIFGARTIQTFGIDYLLTACHRKLPTLYLSKSCQDSCARYRTRIGHSPLVTSRRFGLRDTGPHFDTHEVLTTYRMTTVSLAVVSEHPSWGGLGTALVVIGVVGVLNATTPLGIHALYGIFAAFGAGVLLVGLALPLRMAGAISHRPGSFALTLGVTLAVGAIMLYLVFGCVFGCAA